MAAYPKAAAQVLPQMARILLAWNNSPGVDALLAQLQGDQGLVYLDETLALYAMLTAAVDQVATMAEMSPSLFSGQELLRISSDLDGAVAALKRLGLVPSCDVAVMAVRAEESALLRSFWCSSIRKPGLKVRLTIRSP